VLNPKCPDALEGKGGGIGGERYCFFFSDFRLRVRERKRERVKVFFVVRPSLWNSIKSELVVCVRLNERTHVVANLGLQ